MPWYRVLIEGQNFLVNLEEKPEKLGFYVTKFVEARDKHMAEELAIDGVRRDLEGAVLNSEEDSPIMFVAEMEQVAAQAQDTGYCWFPETAHN